MDPRSRFLSYCATHGPDYEDFTIDVGAVVRRLILFDKYILQSIRLMEVPLLLRLFGYRGLLELLDANVLGFHCDALTMAQVGQVGAPGIRSGRDPLPLGSYYFATAYVPDHEEFVSERMAELEEASGLTRKQFIKLKGAIASRLVQRLPDLGNRALEQLVTDIGQNPILVRRAVATSLRIRLGVKVDPTELTVELSRLVRKTSKWIPISDSTSKSRRKWSTRL
jgi:hypothetical protein